MKYTVEEWSYEFINDLAFYGNGEIVSSYDGLILPPTTQEEAVDFIEGNMSIYSTECSEKNYAIVVNGEAIGNILRHYDLDGQVCKEYYWVASEYASFINLR